MTPKFFNTLTRAPEEFQPLAPGRVGMYTCGPTVYNYAHIGNYRAYVFEDLLRRWLKYCGFQVTQVMNLTDVDDKTIRGARERGLALRVFTQTFKDAFFQDIRTLRIEPAEHYPAATDHIPEMIALIGTLVAKGYAYVSDDRSVYFRIERFKKYGALARLDLEGLKAGARVRQDEYEKEALGDFALWKAWDEADGDVAWDSPWGRGRPGWHIECSAMAMKYLGATFDLHTGGIDNMFPHHEDEIAQSEAATGQPFVRCWMHCAHLVVEGRKMSKSLGNFFTLREVIQKGHSGREIRYLLLATHYRQALNFTFAGLDGARAALQRVDEFMERLQLTAQGAVAGAPPAWAAAGRTAFEGALGNDLNISDALAAVFNMIHDGHKAMNEKSLPPAEAAAVTALFRTLDGVLGVLQPDEQAVPQAVLALVNARQNAKQSQNWAEADRCRDALKALGWMVQDTAQGPKPRRL